MGPTRIMRSHSSRRRIGALGDEGEGVVDEVIDPTEALHARGGDRAAERRVLHVAAEEQAACPAPVSSFAVSAPASLMPVKHTEPPSRQYSSDDGAADARSPARDDGHLPLETIPDRPALHQTPSFSDDRQHLRRAPQERDLRRRSRHRERLRQRLLRRSGVFQAHLVHVGFWDAPRHEDHRGFLPRHPAHLRHVHRNDLRCDAALGHQAPDLVPRAGSRSRSAPGGWRRSPPCRATRG